MTAAFRRFAFPLIAALAQWSCQSQPAVSPMSEGSASARLKPAAAPSGEHRRGRTYVPAYSSIYWGVSQVNVQLSVTLSVRNTSLKTPVIVESVRYYDSQGVEVRAYVTAPSELAPMASVEFVVPMRDRTGGPGANFLVDWAVPKDRDDPFMEAIMVGQHGNAGLSFASPGIAARRE